MALHGPLRVQRPFYPEGPLPQTGLAEPCHCCLLHPPGGLVSGDELSITALVAPGAHALLTAPSATKCYAADACQVPHAQRATLRVRGGLLEWLPRETIVYDGARAELSTDIALDAAARCLGWEALCLGRAAAGEMFTRGRLRQRLSLWRGGRPLLHEALALTAGEDLQHGPYRLQGQAVCATLFAVGRAGGMAAPARTRRRWRRSAPDCRQG
jgi:urease accessory protein